MTDLTNLALEKAHKILASECSPSRTFQYRALGDDEFLRHRWPALEQALLWLRYQDSNGCGSSETRPTLKAVATLIGRDRRPPGGGCCSFNGG